MMQKNKALNNLNDPKPITEHKWDEEIKPVVSICTITFNHEKYIRDAIEGFLIQKTTFPVEIIIHDDASTDDTADIIREYKERCPNLFRTILQDENQWSKRGGSIYSRFVFPEARGKYIALCEGDDYWTDPLKLQKQVEFLEENEEYILSFHPWVELYEGQIKKPESMFSSTHTLLFKKIYLKRPELLNDALNGDTILKFMLRHHGKFKFLKDIKPAVKRRDSGGIWNSLSKKDKVKNKIKTADLMRQGFKNTEYGNNANIKYVKTLRVKDSKEVLNINEIELLLKMIKEKLFIRYILIRIEDVIRKIFK